jgi:HEAT repeat protein
VLPALRSITGEGDADAVAFACYALGQIGSPANSAIDCVAPLQNHDSTLVRIHAAEALLKISDGDSGSVIVLSNALLSASTEERCLAVVALGSAKGADRDAAITALIDSLGDADPSVQQAAALSLGGYGLHAARAEESLTLAAASEDAETRSAVETALACIRK